VETGYHHKSYAYWAQRTEELDRLLRRIQPGDLVLTTERGRAYLGEVAGPAYFTDSGHGLSNVRRDVRWLDHGRPLDASRLAPTRVPALLQSQAYVVDLTQAYEQLAALLPREEHLAPVPAVPRTLAFRR
jgi:5-methylcytosine-specific restriction protein B